MNTGEEEHNRDDGRRGGGHSRGHGDQQEDEGDDAQFLMDNVDNLDDTSDWYSRVSINYGSRLEHCFSILGSHSDTRDLILLDSCSTICLFANAHFLHDIHTVDRTLHI